MTTNNNNSKPTDNMELLKKQAESCGPECGCHAGGSSGRTRIIIGVIVLIAAGVLIARAMLKNDSAVATPKAASEFASLPVLGQASAPKPEALPAATATPAAPEVGAVPVKNETPVVPIQELGKLSELNTVAADTGAVFIYLAGKDEPAIKAPLAQMRGAAKTIEAQASIKIGLFRLKADSPEYVQLATQMQVPGVLAMAKGRGMVPVSGDITEAKLIQGFVAASSAGGCGPSGCGPSGCN